MGELDELHFIIKSKSVPVCGTLALTVIPEKSLALGLPQKSSGDETESSTLIDFVIRLEDPSLMEKEIELLADQTSINQKVTATLTLLWDPIPLYVLEKSATPMKTSNPPNKTVSLQVVYTGVFAGLSTVHS